MKVIDLLNKIANGEEVPMIKFYNRILKYNKEEQWFDDIIDCSYCKTTYEFEELNDEVKIIEEDNKIEPLDIHQEKNCKNNWKWKCNGYNISTPQKIIGEKLNEVIDKLNEMEENKYDN